MDFRYISPTATSLDLDGDVAYTGIAEEVRSTEWDYSIGNSGALAGISRQSRAASVRLYVLDKAQADVICDTFDYDMSHYSDNGSATVEAFGEWTQACLVTKVKLATVTPNAVILECTFLLLDGVWRSVETVHLLPGSGGGETTTGLDYPHDYTFDYAGTAKSSSITTLSSGGALVRCVFFGPCTNPYVRIGSNVYGVNASADANERIVIDPTKRKVIGGSVYKVGAFGEKTNLYDKRRRGAEGSGSYVFQELPPGTVDVSWPQSFGVDLDVIEERGLLPWS